MSDIMSFNQLFVEAARRGLRLNRLDQDTSGLWRANWRVDGEKTWFGPVSDDPTPFLAALKAYTLADLQAPHAGAEKVEAAKVDADLFG